MFDRQSSVPLHQSFGLRSFNKCGLSLIRRKRIQLRQQRIHGWLSECCGSEANQNQGREQKNRLVGIHGASTRYNRGSFCPSHATNRLLANFVLVLRRGSRPILSVREGTNEGGFDIIEDSPFMLRSRSIPNFSEQLANAFQPKPE